VAVFRKRRRSVIVAFMRSRLRRVSEQGKSLPFPPGNECRAKGELIIPNFLTPFTM
jgi:hypothetical protein